MNKRLGQPAAGRGGPVPPDGEHGVAAGHGGRLRLFPAVPAPDPPLLLDPADADWVRVSFVSFVSFVSLVTFSFYLVVAVFEPAGKRAICRHTMSSLRVVMLTWMM